MEDKIVGQEEVLEVVADEEPTASAPVSDDDEPQEPKHEEISLNNNSRAFFDLHEDSIYLIAKHPRLALVVTGGGDNRAFIWSAGSNPPHLVADLTGHSESVVAGGFSSDGSKLVTADMNGGVFVWQSLLNGQKWQLMSSIQEVEGVIWVEMHPNQPIFALGAQDNSVWIHSLEPELASVSVLFSHNLPTNGGLWFNVEDVDALNLVTYGDDGMVVAWNAYTSTALWSLRPGGTRSEAALVSACLSPSGKSMALGSDDGLLAIVGLAQGNLLTTVDSKTLTNIPDPADAGIEALGWRGSYVVTGNIGGQLTVYDVDTWKPRNTIPLDEALTKLEFVSAHEVFVAGMDGCVRLYDIRSGNLKWTGEGHSEGILGFVTLPGPTLVTASDDGVALVFDVKDSSALTVT